MFYSVLPRSSFPVCGKLCCLLSCLEWRSWSHGWNILSIFIAFFCKPLKWTPHNSTAGNPSTLNACISNLCNVFLIFLLFRFLAVSFSNLRVSSVHTTELVLFVSITTSVYSRFSTFVLLPATVSPPVFPTLYHPHLISSVSHTHLFPTSLHIVTLISDLSLLGYL